MSKQEAQQTETQNGAEPNPLIVKMQMGLMSLEKELEQLETQREELRQRIEEQRGALRMAQILSQNEEIQRQLLPHLFSKEKAVTEASEPSKTPSPNGRA